MKSEALQIVRDTLETDDQRTAGHRLREYLQHQIMRILFKTKYLQNWVFHGGTCLRMIYGFHRFSEDLDFHLKKNADKPDWERVKNNIQRELDTRQYETRYKAREKTAVYGLFIKFENLLHTAGLSPHENETFDVKIELDINPPGGFTAERRTIERYDPFPVIHHDRPTLLAGKIGAIEGRDYTKGRDFYDVITLLRRQPRLSPNIPYLNNVLSQTSPKTKPFQQSDWRPRLKQSIHETDWDAVTKDIEAFLTTPEDLPLYEKKIVLSDL